MNGLYYYYRGNRAAVKRAARWGKDVYHMMRGKRWVCLALCLLTLLGAFLFLCIWETRARYFFQFMMVLLCAGAMFAPKRAD